MTAQELYELGYGHGFRGESVVCNTTSYLAGWDAGYLRSQEEAIECNITPFNQTTKYGVVAQQEVLHRVLHKKIENKVYDG